MFSFDICLDNQTKFRKIIEILSNTPILSYVKLKKIHQEEKNDKKISHCR